MLPAEITFKITTEPDRNRLRDVDLKSFHTPWTHSEWQEAGNQPRTYLGVVELKGVLIGFALWQRNPEPSEVNLRRLAVRPDCQGSGIGTYLLQQMENHARKIKLQWACAVALELWCSGGRDVGAWLRANGYRAYTPLLPNYAIVDGVSVDAIPFKKELTNECFINC